MEVFSSCSGKTFHWIEIMQNFILMKVKYFSGAQLFRWKVFKDESSFPHRNL